MNNRIIVIVTICLALVAGGLIITYSNSSLRGAKKDFKVEEIDQVDKIFLADKSHNTILLEKGAEGNWTVNKAFKARPDAVASLLNAIQFVEVKSPVAKAATNNVLNDLASSGVKVEIYKQGKRVRTYYVGGADQEMTGTFMLIEGSSAPFITHVPGFNGYLTPRYFTLIKEWKAREIFNVKPAELAEVSIQYYEAPSNSFTMTKVGNKYQVRSIQTNQLKANADTAFCRYYTSCYQNRNYEGPSRPGVNADSIMKSPVWFDIQVKDIKGKIRTVHFYHKANDAETPDDNGKLYKYDIERLYGRVDGTSDLFLVQYYVIEKLTIGIDNFVRPGAGLIVKGREEPK